MSHLKHYRKLRHRQQGLRRDPRGNNGNGNGNFLQPIVDPSFFNDFPPTPPPDSPTPTPAPTLPPAPPADSPSTTTSASLIFSVAPVIDPFSTTDTLTTSSSLPTTTTTSSTTSPSSTSSPPSSSTTSTTSIHLEPTTTPLTSSVLTRTFIQSVSSVSHSSSVSPSSTNTPTGGVSTGAIAGGIFAAILGCAGILAAVVYFLRKCRRREDEAFPEEIWNRTDARGQSAILEDEPELVRPSQTHSRSSPRPPTMIERHLNNTPIIPARGPTVPNMYPNNAYENDYGATNYSQNSFSPGQVVSPHSANPFFSPYVQDVMDSPVSNTVPEYHDPPHSGGPALPPPVLTREPFIGIGQTAVPHQNSVTGPYNPVVSSPDATDPHYTELSRSSVTPFQAAQYAEITEKLGTPMPSVMNAVPEEQEAVEPEDMAVPPQDELSTHGRNAHTESPFADAASVQPADNSSYEPDDGLPPHVLEPPRIPSLPPTLPEIDVPERFSPVGSLEFPVPASVCSSPTPFSAEFSDMRVPPPIESIKKSGALAGSAPVQAQAQASVIPREHETGAGAPRPDTVYTIYDEEDAYGGM